MRRKEITNRIKEFIIVMFIQVEEEKRKWNFSYNLLIIPVIFAFIIRLLTLSTLAFFIIFTLYVSVTLILFELTVRYIKKTYKNKVKIWDRGFTYFMLFYISFFLSLKTIPLSGLLIGVYMSLSNIIIYTFSFHKAKKRLENSEQINKRGESIKPSLIIVFVIGYALASISIFLLDFLNLSLSFHINLLLFTTFSIGNALFILSLSEIINYYLYKILKELNKSIEEREEIKTMPFKKHKVDGMV